MILFPVEIPSNAEQHHEYHAIITNIINIFPAAVSANAEQHLCREQQHNRLPRANRHNLPTDGTIPRKLFDHDGCHCSISLF